MARQAVEAAQQVWEYKTVDSKMPIGDQNMETLLNELGADRWELVSAMVNGWGFTLLYFKRPKV